jgi:hypothetical protein
MGNLIRTSLIVTLLLFLLASPLHSTAHAAAPDHEPGQIVVKLAPSSADDLLAINQTYGTTGSSDDE